MRTYPEYKDSGVEWIGEIPKGWNTKRIKHLSQVKRGSSPRPIDDPKYFDDENGEYSWVRISDVSASEKYLEKTTQKLSELGSSLSTKMTPGDIFLSIAGTVGKPIITNIKCCIHDGFVWFENLDYEKELLYRIFLTGVCFQGLGKMGTQLNLNTDTVGGISIPIPPPSEQKQISDYLDRKTQQIDDLIEKTERKIELLKEQRSSLINQCVTKGLDPNVEMKDSGVEWIGEIPSHWNRVRVKHLVSIKVTDGPHETPEFVDKGIPFLSVEGVVGNKIDLDRVRGYITPELHNQYSKKCKPVRDDVLLVKSGSTTGKSTIVDFDIEFNIWSPLCILRSNKSKVNPIFLFNSVQSRYFVTQVEINWSYGTQPNIGMGVIEELWIVLPPLYEQSDINNYLKTRTQELDHLISTHNRKINLYQEYHQSLISSVVTGKVRVTEDMV